MSSSTGPVRTAFRTLWPLLGRDRRWLAPIGVCLVLAATAETAGILYFGDLVDGALKAGNLGAFWAPALRWLGAATAGAVVAWSGNALAAWIAERFIMRLRARTFAHVQTLPPDFFQRHRTGDLVERLTGDVEAVEGLLVSTVLGAASSAVSALFFATAAFALRWELALAAFVLAPAFWLVARRFGGTMRSLAQDSRQADGGISSVVQESLTNIELTQAFDRARDEEARLQREASAWFRAALRSARLAELYGQLVEVIETVCVLAVIGLGAWEISAGRMTLGELLAFAAFLGYLYPPVRSLGQLGLTAAQAGASAQRLLEVLDARPSVTDPESPVRPTGPRAHGTLALRRVTFRYPGADRPALAELSLTAAPGELLALTGPSGAGKSTATKLLLRFYDPDQGELLLDGVPLDRLPLPWLRANVALLSQRTRILHATVYENIACGRPGATPREVYDAARAADAHEFIEALDEGYDTLLDPTVQRLSGGQLQRIAIARTMLRDAPVLVLDEPTTGLDALAAQRVMGPLRRLMAGRTTLLISHDLGLVADADRILVLEAGRLVEQGPHHELLARNGTYARLHRAAGRTPALP